VRTKFETKEVIHKRFYFNHTYMIPPTFPEVGEPVTECDLEELKDYAVDPAHLYIADNHHFEPPSKQVSKEVHVHCRLVHINEAAMGVFRGEYAAVLCVRSLWQLLAKLLVEELKDASCIV
jgi:hypothetical protein